MMMHRIMFFLVWALVSANMVFAGTSKDSIAILEPVEDGEILLSDHFITEVSKGYFGPRTIKIFHSTGNTKQLLGVSNFSEYGSRQNGYAISSDGRTLLYFHQNKQGREGIDKKSGLYEYVEGRGDRLVHPGVNNGAYINQRLPADMIVFRRMIKKPDSYRIEGHIILRDTSGNERRWETSQ